MRRRRRFIPLTMLLYAAAALSFGCYSLAASVADEAGRHHMRRVDGEAAAASPIASSAAGGRVGNSEHTHTSGLHRRQLQTSTAPPPRNNDCVDAPIIPTLPYQSTSTTAGATADFDGPSCGAFRYANGVWYSYTPAESTILTASVEGAGVRIYSGGCDNLACVSQYEATHDFVALAGVEYLFLVSKVSFSQGAEFTFRLFTEATPFPTPSATKEPSPEPTPRPTNPPTTARPTERPVAPPPTPRPTPDPTLPPAAGTAAPATMRPTAEPSASAEETKAPSAKPSRRPTPQPTPRPSQTTTRRPTRKPIASTDEPTEPDETSMPTEIYPPTPDDCEEAYTEWSPGTKGSKMFKPSKTGKLFKKGSKCSKGSKKGGVAGKSGKGSKSSKSSKGVSGKSAKRSGSSGDYWSLNRLNRIQMMSNGVEGGGRCSWVLASMAGLLVWVGT